MMGTGAFFVAVDHERFMTELWGLRRLPPRAMLVASGVSGMRGDEDHLMFRLLADQVLVSEPELLRMPYGYGWSRLELEARRKAPRFAEVWHQALEKASRWEGPNNAPMWILDPLWVTRLSGIEGGGVSLVEQALAWFRAVPPGLGVGVGFGPPSLGTGVQVKVAAPMWEQEIRSRLLEEGLPTWVSVDREIIDHEGRRRIVPSEAVPADSRQVLRAYRFTEYPDRIVAHHAYGVEDGRTLWFPQPRKAPFGFLRRRQKAVGRHLPGSCGNKQCVVCRAARLLASISSGRNQ